ncbi:MAG: four helix bundle protein [Terriglobia bacterium]
MNVDGAKPRDLRDRTREFALRVIKLYCALPKRIESQVIGKQILRSGTAVGANYREGLRSRSKSEYAAKLNIGLMEIEETLYWLELLEGSGIVSASRLAAMKAEIFELTVIFVTLIKKAKLQTGSHAPSESV